MPYFDLDTQRDKSRVFSKIEVQRMEDIITAVNDSLNGDNEVIWHWLEIATCDHNRKIIYYFVELRKFIISLDEIREITERLEELHISLLHIVAMSEKRHCYQRLILCEEQDHEVAAAAPQK